MRALHPRTSSAPRKTATHSKNPNGTLPVNNPGYAFGGLLCKTGVGRQRINELRRRADA